MGGYPTLHLTEHFQSELVAKIDKYSKMLKKKD